MKRTHVILSIAAALIFAGFGAVHAQENLAQQAYAILEHSCSSCHGKGGSFTSDILIEHSALIADGHVVPGSPFTSSLFLRLVSDSPEEPRMPLGQPQLPPEALATISTWILEGAPNWEVEYDVSFISTRQMLTAMQDHLGTLSAFDRPFARYFTTTHLYNVGASPEALRDYRAALSKLVNSLSWGRRIRNPQPIDTAETIFYIDLRDYDWDRGDAWTRIEQDYPYNIEFNAETQAGLREQLTNLQSEMHCEVPFVQVDWFLAAAALPPLYHDILDLPTTDAQLERLLDIDVAWNLANAPGRRVWRAGFNESGVSNHNRVVERHESSYGAYWKSYDFASSAGNKDIHTHPLSFEKDGGEVIFNLPNGLQAYYITDEFGTRIDVAPTDIVSNPAASDPAVRNGLSCIGCHTEGMQHDFEDTVRQAIERTTNPAYDKDHALRLYVEQAVMDDLLAEDAERFQAALAETGGTPEDIEPVHRFYEVYQGPVTAAYAAATVGLQTEAFLREIEDTPHLQNLGLTGLLSEGGNVKRDTWTANFQDIVEVLYDPSFQPPVVVIPPPVTPAPAVTLDPDSGLSGIIPDPNLHAAVAAALGKDPNAEITVADMASLEGLIANNSGIIELTGLEHAVNLGHLNLRHNQITDVSAVRNLRRVQEILLQNNPVSDISPLAGMLGLQHVDARETNVTDFSPLAGLQLLRKIQWGDNPETQLPDLTGLTRLEELDIHNTDITDLSGLPRLTSLRELHLDNNRIEDISGLSGLPALTYLGLHNNDISDISGLSELPALTHLGLNSNDISDISGLSELPALTYLELNSNDISDISGLSELPALTYLGLSDNVISDISGLSGLPALTYLELSSNDISDIAGLSELPALTELWLNSNDISDISGLSELPALTELGLHNNNISDVSPLASLKNLIVLELESNRISDVSPLASLKNLIALDLGNNRISDFSPLEALFATTAIYTQGNPGFESGGPKITGPWLWAIVPGDSLNDTTDFLSKATGGAATEVKVSTEGATEGKRVGKRKWMRHALSAEGNNNINEMTESLGWGTGEEIYDHIVYGSIALNTTAAQDTTMFVGSDDACKVWLNGELVHKAYVRRGAGDYQSSFPVSLKSGRNVLLVALDNRGHGRFSGFFGFAPDAEYDVEELASFSFSAQTEELAIGDTFTLRLNTERIDSLGGWQADIVFDPNVLRVVRVTEGDFMTQGGRTTFFSEGTLRNQRGEITGIQAAQLTRAGRWRNGTLLEIEFRAHGNGEALVRAENFQAGDMDANEIGAPAPEITIVVGTAPGAPQWETDVVPEATALLANYPNPFNPETWIPYHLSAPADVTLRIYATDGRLIRHLNIGHQLAGIYQHQGRAAYWDGRNATGERVASGLYFYTLTAGEFTATRKMLILK